VVFLDEGEERGRGVWGVGGLRYPFLSTRGFILFLATQWDPVIPVFL